MQDFRKIRAWDKARLVVLDIYRMTAGFPSSELYGLTNQLRRAAVSVTANIAEGCGRGSDADFARFLQIAVGSSFEVDALLLVAKDLGFLSAPEYATLEPKIAEMKRMLNALLQTVRQGQ